MMLTPPLYYYGGVPGFSEDFVLEGNTRLKTNRG